MPKIIIDDRIPYIHGLLDSVAETLYLPYAEITSDTIRDADALIIRTRTKCNSALLKGTSVRLIVTATIGTDHIDLDYCRANNIAVKNAPGCNAGSVAQWVAAVLKMVLPPCRDARPCVSQEYSGIISKDARPCVSTGDGTSRISNIIGIVGYGNVGKRVKTVAEELGFTVLISDPPLGYMTTLNELAEQCRIITFHTPLTTTGDYPTLGMADEQFFKKMPENGLIINAARGGIIDEPSLKRWLKRNSTARCAIDCWANEPHIDPELLQLAMISTPHIAGYSADGKWNGTRMSVQAVNDFFHINGKMPAPLPLAKNSFYDIKYDSDLLKHNPALFEFFRGHYRQRRE